MQSNRAQPKTFLCKNSGPSGELSCTQVTQSFERDQHEKMFVQNSHADASCEDYGTDMTPDYLNPEITSGTDYPAQFTSGSSAAAVGPDRVLMNHSSGRKLFSKATMTQLDSKDLNSFFTNPGGSSGGNVAYDILSGRFVTTASFSVVKSAEITFPTGSGPVTIAARKSVSNVQTFNLTRPIVASVPDIAFPNITNGAALAGNIALIKRSPLSSFAAKIDLAFAAGAVAVIFYDINPGPPISLAGTASPNPSSAIPVVAITAVDGALLLTNLPVTATLKDVPNEGQGFLNLAISKTSSPSSLTTADWHIYGPIAVPALINRTLAFPPPTFTSNEIIIEVQSGEPFSALTGPSPTATSRHDRITILKSQALNGVQPTPNLSLLSLNGGEKFPIPRVPYSEPNPSSDYFNFLPDSFDTPQNIYNRSLQITAFIFYRNSNFHNPIRVPLPEPLLGFDRTVSQPGPVKASTPLGAYVQKDQSLWIVLQNTDGNTGKLHWYEIDIKQARLNRLSIRQYGVLKSCTPGESYFAAGINVNIYGDVLISYNIVSPTRPLSVGYAGRLVDDPKGSLRAPTNLLVQGTVNYVGSGSANVFNSATATVPITTSAVSIDASDGETFYAGGGRYKPFGAGVTWQIALARLRIEPTYDCDDKPQRCCPDDVDCRGNGMNPTY